MSSIEQAFPNSVASSGIDGPAAGAGLSRGQYGMLAFLASEAAFFSTLVVVYLKYLGQDKSGPTPAGSLHLSTAVLNTCFLVSSSVTIARAAVAMGAQRTRAAVAWVLATIVLGCAFLALTGREWLDLIFVEGLTLRRNLFGTTYFTLIGFHAAHVSVGLIAMILLLTLVRSRVPRQQLAGSLELVSWYWHFVDGVWIVILLVVYVVGR